MRFIRSFIAHLTTLLLAAGLAVIIWAAAVRAADPEVTHPYSLPIQVVGQPPNSILLSQADANVFITVEGPESAMQDVTADDFAAVIDLSTVPFGESEVEVEVQFAHDLIRLNSQFPERTAVHLERIITREIEVMLDLRGEVARGHSRGDPLLDPAYIEVTGPATRVEQLVEARVTAFLDNARETMVVVRRPIFYDQQGSVAATSGLSLSHDEVEITIPVNELAGFAEKPITAAWDGDPAQGYRLLNVVVQPASVLVSGPPGLLEQLRAIQTEPIDITGLTQSFTQQVSLILPDGITLDEPQPVIVTVEIEPILTSAVVRKAPELRALGAGLTAQLEPEEVRIFLFGPLPVLDSLEDDDVRVTLDLLNLDEGVYNLEPIVDVFANEVEVRSYQPLLITVILTRETTATVTFRGPDWPAQLSFDLPGGDSPTPYWPALAAAWPI